MTQATVQQFYRGVLCLHCKQPIPIPSLVATMEAELRQKDSTLGRHQKCQVFSLRCAKCGKEKPYRVGEIVEIEGDPGDSDPVDRLSPARSPWPADVSSKAANA